MDNLKQPSVRDRRMEAEWHRLQMLADANPTVIQMLVRHESSVSLMLCNSPTWIAQGDTQQITTDATMRYEFPRFYPSLPLEGYFTRPIFHPNVDPVTGFVCLWQQHRTGTTMVEAIQITRAIMAHRTVNMHSEHCMQPMTVIMRELEYAPLLIPESCRLPSSPPQTKGRVRLSSFISTQ